MLPTRQQWLLVTPALLAQAAWLFGMFEGFVTMRALDHEHGVWSSGTIDSSLVQAAALAVARLVLSTWGLLTTRISRWWVPVLAGAYELAIYATQVAIAFGYFETFASDPDLLGHALLTPGFRHFWILPLAPAIIVPTLALRATQLFSRVRPGAA